MCYFAGRFDGFCYRAPSKELNIQPSKPTTGGTDSKIDNDILGGSIGAAAIIIGAIALLVRIYHKREESAPNSSNNGSALKLSRISVISIDSGTYDNIDDSQIDKRAYNSLNHLNERLPREDYQVLHGNDSTDLEYCHPVSFRDQISSLDTSDIQIVSSPIEDYLLPETQTTNAERYPAIESEKYINPYLQVLPSE